MSFDVILNSLKKFNKIVLFNKFNIKNKVHFIHFEMLYDFYEVPFLSNQFMHCLFSSPEPKAQGEILVSKGDTPASVVRRHASTIVFHFENAGQYCRADLPKFWSVASL
jgi:hypothetical protein